jgi:hypothetical protein
MRESTNATMDEIKVIAADLRYLTAVLDGFSVYASMFSAGLFGAGEAVGCIEAMMGV